MRYFGTVIWFKDKFGFLSWEKDGVPQPDIFVHYSDLDIPGFRKLKEGENVSFSLGENYFKKLKATQVCLENK